MSHLDRKELLQSGSTALAAVLLWDATFSLLGLPAPMAPGLKIGSLIVFAGCYVLCRGLVAILFIAFAAKASMKKAVPADLEDEEAGLTRARPRVALYRSPRPPSPTDN